jgi:hypothetical protein
MIRMDDARACRLFLVVLLALPWVAASAGTARDTDLDQFMAQVLARRDENWRKLQQYILDERETAELLGPGGTRLFGLARDYTWYVRDGVFVRSPLAFGGVNLSEADRRKYEDEWIAREARRHEKAETPAPPGQANDIDSLMRLAREPQFVSAAYFLRFRFEPGHYAFAGPDTYEGQRVLKIEYYPSKLYTRDDEKRAADKRAGDDSGADESEAEIGARLNRQFNKVALVTLWVEPDTHQIVKYVFDNVGFDFLPGRFLARVEDVHASMEMSQPFAGVWLPKGIAGRGGVTLANGTYEVRYAISYHDYREAEVKAKVR